MTSCGDNESLTDDARGGGAVEVLIAIAKFLAGGIVEGELGEFEKFFFCFF